MENIITLKCFHCGKTKEVAINGDIQFAFELYQIANDAGMFGVIDSYRRRSLVFCDKKCLETHKTKKGAIRARAGY